MRFHTEACVPVISHRAFVLRDKYRPGPFPIAAGKSLIPIFEAHGVGQDKKGALETELVCYFLRAGRVEPVVVIVVCDCSLNRLFAGDVRLMGFPVLFQLPVLPCVLCGLIVHRRCAELFFLGNQIICLVFNEVLECFHVPCFNLTEAFIEIGKGCAMPQQGVGLFIRQFVVFKEKQDIFPHCVFVSVVQDFFG